MSEEKKIEKQVGQVAWFDDAKGYGFIKKHNDQYFVHHKNIAMEGYKTLKKNSFVDFIASSTDKGLVAQEVTPRPDEN